MTSGPSPAGIAELRAAAADLGYKSKPPKRRLWPRWLTAKRLALLLVADLIIGSVGWHYLTKPHPGAVTAALEQTANNAAHNHWDSVYGELCSTDRAQTTEPDLAGAGRAALLSIGELDHVTVTSVQPVQQAIGPLHWAAAQASGMLVPVIGQPSPYTITLVHEMGGWHVCLSAGGYSSTAMHVNVPVGTAFTP